MHASSRRPSTSRAPPVVPPGVAFGSGRAFVQASSQHRGRSMPSAGMPPPLSSTSSLSSRPSPGLSSSSSHKSPRQASANLGWGGDRVMSPQEPDLVTPKEQYTAQVEVNVDTQFDNLLDSLQVPASVREKFATVSSDVKSIILTSSLSSNATILTSLGLPLQKEPPNVKKRMPTPLLRKAKSSSSLNSPIPDPKVGKTYAVEGDQFVIVASPVTHQGGVSPSHLRGQSIDIARPTNGRSSTAPRPLSNIFGASSSTTSLQSMSKAKGLGIAMGERPEAFIQWLQSHKATDLKMQVARGKKLRMLLRHESTAWVASFIEQGGYKLVLARLQDLLDIEWREEQHDDQMLYEMLRCVKALSTSEVGKEALRSSFPDPFPALSKLLFSEKKPGDILARQIIVELWLFLFDLYPTHKTGSRVSSVRFDRLPDPVDITTAVRDLLAPESEDPTKDHHEFVTRAHRPRVFKSWVQELSDICRDYFWVMCHSSNTLWDIGEVDESLVERPVAPGGATGGVEFEAMNYATTHFKLLNALCAHQAQNNRQKAANLHGELLSSGMDRILVTMRKASTTYYPTLHLELARYVALLRAASPSGRLPHLLDKLVGSPPEALRRRREYDGRSSWLPMPVSVSERRGSREVRA